MRALQSKEDYRIEVRRLQEFLAAGDEGILAHVERLMRDAADRLDFEEAQFFKSRFSSYAASSEMEIAKAQALAQTIL